MDWSVLVDSVFGIYMSGLLVFGAYFVSRYYVLQSREEVAVAASRGETIRKYVRGVASALLLAAFFVYASSPSSENGDIGDTEAPVSNPWQAFATAALILVPMTLFGPSDGFRMDGKRRHGQRLVESMDEDDLRRRPELTTVADSNLPVYARCCLFSEGFADGSRQDYIDLVIQRAGRPQPNDTDWLGRVILDVELRRGLEVMVTENASYMHEDAKFVFWHGLPAAVMDQEFARDIRTRSRKGKD